MNDFFRYDVVIAHGPGCKDGATAAWAFWRTLPEEYRQRLSNEGGFYSNTPFDETQPIDYNNKYVHPNSPAGGIKLQQKGYPVVFVFSQPGNVVPEELVKDKNVIILDLDMEDALVPVVSAAKSVLLSDHHDSTTKTLLKHSQFLFSENSSKFATFVNTDKKESGASLAWCLSNGGKIPPLVQVVRISDTWSWNEYPELHARATITGLDMLKCFRSFESIERTFNEWDSKFPAYHEKGYLSLDYQNSIVRKMAKQCSLGFIESEDGTVYRVGYVQTTVLQSEVAASIRKYAERRFGGCLDFCAAWKYNPFTGVHVSIRDPIPGINLASVARSVKGGGGKGGGHPLASGFTIPSIEVFHDFIQKSDPSCK